MTTRASLAVLLASLLPFASAAQSSSLPGTAVIYVNGVWNDDDDAFDNLNELKRSMAQIIPASELQALDIDYAYNETFGSLEDLQETFEQLDQLDSTQFLRWLSGLDPLPDVFQNAFLERAEALDLLPLITVSGLSEHVQRYRDIISGGRGVVLVAHSQGNLFANQSFAILSEQEQQCTSIVAVATPADFVAGDGPHTTLVEDKVIIAITLRRGGDVLPSNVTNFGNPDDWSGHRFIDSYLRENSENQILVDVDNALIRLASTSILGSYAGSFEAIVQGEPRSGVATLNVQGTEDAFSGSFALGTNTTGSFSASGRDFNTVWTGIAFGEDATGDLSCQISLASLDAPGCKPSIQCSGTGFTSDGSGFGTMILSKQ